MTGPFLRAPPFPAIELQLSRPAENETGVSDDLLDLIRAARVGGSFWLQPAKRGHATSVVIRPGPRDSRASLREIGAGTPEDDMLWVERDDIDPWSVIEGAGQLVAHGDDEWVAIAHLARVPVHLLSAGRYGAPADTAAMGLDRVRAALSGTSYIDPFTGLETTAEAIITLLAEWRRLIDANHQIAAACGIAWWKRDEIRRFLWVPGRKLPFISGDRHALEYAQSAGGAIAVWPSRVSDSLISGARRQATPLARIEDGFVRSVGLGSNLVPPSSVVVDMRGIYFDPSRPSDLEHILATHQFTADMQGRAHALRQRIVTAGISKYAVGSGSQVPQREPGRRLVLVPAQVEDDMSVIAGGGGNHSNLDLLRRVRAMEPDSEIWFRPHPDVDAGHRKGAVPDDQVMQYADRIVRDGSMAPLLGTVDAVHTLTSLTGFEALMRGLEVICHGTPFYAGWGLTQDLGEVPDRRGRRLKLDQLVAGVLILYPRYLDPQTRLPCPPEVLVDRLANAATTNRLGWVAPLRRWQGRFMAKFR